MQFLVSLSLVLPALAAPIASPQLDGLEPVTSGLSGGGLIPGILARKIAVRHGAGSSHGSEEDESTVSVGVDAKVAARSPLEGIDDMLGPVVDPSNLIKKRNAHGGPPGQKHEQEKDDDESLLSLEAIFDALRRRAEHGNPHGGHESDHKEEDEGGLVAVDAEVKVLKARDLMRRLLSADVNANINAEVNAEVNADVNVDVGADADANVDVTVGGEDEKESSHPSSHGPGYGPSHPPSHGSGYGSHAKTRDVDEECFFGDEEKCEISLVVRDAPASDEGLANVKVTIDA